ncbi:hypothetical protein JCM11491_004503 [Sporobolomyces phaffii]
MPRKAPIKRSASSSPRGASAVSRRLPSSPLSSPEPDDTKPPTTAAPAPAPATALSASAKKKIQLYDQTRKVGTPFPHWAHPTPDEAQLVCDRLASVHGMPTRPEVLVDRPGAPAGCGQTPSVLDALVRTILSQNTTSKNSTRAKLSMDERYGRAAYRKVLEAGEDALEDAIRCGGLAKQKSKSIMGVLRRLDERQRNEGKGAEGELSLDWLHGETDEAAMKELISYDLVGIKTASCVLLFCLGRSSFAVDTHVHRLTQSLGWLPPTGSVHTLSASSSGPSKYVATSKTTTPPSRDQTFYHLDATLPDELKYPLHSLLVRHGRGCVKCAANGVTTQDIVDTCPIDDLIVRGRGGRKAAAKHKVKVETEDGKVVGSVEEGRDGDFKVDVKEDVAGEVGERNKVGKRGRGTKIEDEVNQTTRPSRASKRAAAANAKVKDEAMTSSSEEVEDDDGEDDFKPEPETTTKTIKATTRPRVKRTSSSNLSDTLPKAKRGRTTPKKQVRKIKAEEDEHSVDRDEAEMSGRAWKSAEGTMHGLDG